MLHSIFFDAARRTPDAPALWVDERMYSYSALASCAWRVAARLADHAGLYDRQAEKPCLLFASRSLTAYAGLLGILSANMAYVPLNPKFPAARNAAIASRCGARVILVDRRCAEKLHEVLSLVDESIEVVLIDDEALANGAPAAPPARTGSPADTAYLMFTSGTTGVPKGVRVTHANTMAYISGQLQYNLPVPGARYSQFFDLTFDPSVHDMFVCWGNGATLYVPETIDTLYLASFIPAHGITHWGSVPSVAGFMQQFRKLKDNVFPTLQVSMFCGEALPNALALAWQRAAPGSSVINLYGPTEATVTCLRFEATPEFLTNPLHTVVPLGWSTPGQETVIVDDKLEPVEAGVKGELLLGGNQLASGYLTLNPADHLKFFERSYPGKQARRWYRSGDLASVTTDCGVVFHGRIDTQVKIRGNRIELQEVEKAVQAASGAAMAAVIAWPRDATGTPLGLVAFVLEPRVESRQALRDCMLSLPAYGVPDRIVELDAFPLNGSGKIDRNALVAMCAPNAVAS
jgi:D-alanine--poly(phosphoribitol) ligase subunit 1